MPANVSTQYHETGNVSFHAAGAVVGKTFVKVSANRTGGPALSTDLESMWVMSTCPAGLRPTGVAKYDVADTKPGGVHGQPGMIVPVTAGSAITAGQEVEVGTNGQAIPLATGKAAGQAMSGAAGAADCPIKLY